MYLYIQIKNIMKTKNDSQLQNVSLPNLFNEVFKSLSSEVQPIKMIDPKIDSKDGAGKMQELLLGSLVTQTIEDEIYKSELDAGQEKSNKQVVWQQNHRKIQQVMIQYIQGKGKLPTKTEIAHFTGLSRVCIHEHLKDDETYNLFKGELSKVRLMSSVLLSKLMELALKGELRAIKMLLEIIQDKHNASTGIQNNYIQINNTRIDNAMINSLSREAQEKIEAIIKSEF